MLCALCQLTITLVTLQTEYLVTACPCMLDCKQVSGGCAQQGPSGSTTFKCLLNIWDDGT